jgi:tetratricopeptide (TPR) repeat protein
MSYINDALKKAQREKDGHCRPDDDIPSRRPDRPSRPRRKWALALAMAAASALTALAVWVALAVLTERPTDKKQRQSAGHPAAAVSHSAAAVRENTPGPTALSEADKTGGSGYQADATLLYQEALAAQRRNETAQAEDLYKRTLRIDPGHVHAMNNLGVIYMGRNLHEQAISLFEQALLRKRHYADPYYNLACLYARRGDTGQALANLQAAIDIDEKVIEWARQDADLTNIRSTEAFRKIMEKKNN